MWRLYTVVWLIVLGVMPVRAAEPTQEMILLRRENPAVWSWRYGDLYTYNIGDDTPKRLTNSGNITAPALSPDGKTIAYAAIAESILDEAETGKYTFDIDRDDPMDMWLMDKTTHQVTRIAEQPNDNPTIFRSSPVWSPDSQQLAWFTWDGTSEGGSVVIYDLATGKSTLTASGLMMNMGDAGMFNLPNLIGWGGQIAHTVFRVDNVDQALCLETIDKSGSIGRQIIAHTDYLPRIMWVKHEDSWWVATQTMEDKWQLIQPDTGKQIDQPTIPLLQLANGNGPKLKPDSTAWKILAENGAIVPIPSEGLAAIAPDGKSVVNLRERKAFVWRGGQEIVPLLPGKTADWEIISLVWSPMIWIS